MVFLASDVPHSMKPKPQRFPSTMKNSSGGNRSLPSTLNAMEKPSIRSPSTFFSAMRANKALRPSHCSQVFDTSGLSAKPILKFKQVPWVIFLHEEAYYILCSLESSAYPSTIFFFIYRIAHYFWCITFSSFLVISIKFNIRDRIIVFSIWHETYHGISGYSCWS